MTETIEFAQALTRIPSVNPHYDSNSNGEVSVAEWLVNWGKRNGLAVSTHEVLPGRSNVVVTLRNGADHPHLLFNGHMDTVGVQRMTIPAFGGEISNGRLWGRGSADMKGPDACMLGAALELKRDLSSWRGTVTLGFVVDEEYRFSGIKVLMDKIATPDFAIVGEPTSMDVVRGCKGVLRFTARAKGRAAHSCDPSRGRSAILAMSDACLQMNDYFDQRLSQIRRPEFGCSTGSIGIIEGGNGINIVPESCSIQVDVRLVPGQDWATTYREIQECVRTKARVVEGIEWSFDDPPLIDIPFETAASDPLVLAALKSFGKKSAGVVPYGCDGSKISAKGIPTIIAGPGQIEQGHTANESIAVAELEEGTQLYTKLARALLPA
jgi:acetylornithine deacetylase